MPGYGNIPGQLKNNALYGALNQFKIAGSILPYYF